MSLFLRGTAKLRRSTFPAISLRLANMQRTQKPAHNRSPLFGSIMLGSTSPRRAITAGLPYLAILSLAVLCCGGCGADNPLGRLAISGSVTLDGEPLPSGTIAFAPQDPAGVSSGGMISEGAYAIVAERGLPPGTYDVRIFSPDSDDTAPAGPPGPLGPPAVEERLPARYNTETELSITVTADGSAEFDFPLESSSP
jgi:hypothetical protein